jgi:hypothetical protein
VLAVETSGILNENQSPKLTKPGDSELKKLIEGGFLIKNLWSVARS